MGAPSTLVLPSLLGHWTVYGVLDGYECRRLEPPAARYSRPSLDGGLLHGRLSAHLQDKKGILRERDMGGTGFRPL